MVEMRGWIQDCLRWIIGLGFSGLGLALQLVHWFKIRTFFGNQRRLRQHYAIGAEVPILSYGEELEKLIQRAASQAGQEARFALTSGSTARPKRIFYTKRRLRSVRLAFMDVFARSCWALGMGRTSLYIFSSFGKDDSLTSLLLEESKFPPYLATLQAPNRIECHKSIQDLASSYGANAVRLWILAIANPGVLYSTNPSTLSNFLDELAASWPRSSQLIRDFSNKPGSFESAIGKIARRLASRGSPERLRRIAASPSALPLEICAPAVEAYICWTGGYVKPFLDRLASHLPSQRYRLIPMYSMSTETLQTLSHFGGDSVAFLPLASRVLYEFLEEGEEGPEKLRTPGQLQVGRSYTMVVSDPYGLRRYQTGDLFLCRGFVSGLPDLCFMRRQGLEYSFTGEKLTAEHVSSVFEKLREQFEWLKSGDFLTCVPSQPEDEPIPHYKLVLIGDSNDWAEISGSEVARRCDDWLGRVNLEYKSKRASRRLGPVQFMGMPLSDFVDRIGGSQHQGSWQTQFKFLPLYRRTWEEVKRWG